MIGRLSSWFLFALLVCGSVSCQSPLDLGFGLNHAASYSGGEVDHVSLANGNLAVKIPLFSLPQKGGLSLGFSLVLNNNGYTTISTCDPSVPYQSCYYNVVRRMGIGPSLVMDQSLKVTWSVPYADPNMSNVLSADYAVIDSTGAAHVLLYDKNDFSNMLAVEGSGISFKSLNPYAFDVYGNGPFDPSFDLSQCDYTTAISMPGTITTGSGLKHVFHAEECIAGETDPLTGSTMFRGPLTTLQDSQGNSLKYYTYQPSSGDPDTPGAITDSLARTIANFALVPKNPSVDGCPNLGIVDEPVAFSRTWTVPGPNGHDVSYLFCYTTVRYNTDFMGLTPRTGPHYPPFDINCVAQPSPCYSSSPNYYVPEAFGEREAIQSVVLPDKTYWGFAYDTIGSCVPQSLQDSTLPDLGTCPVAYGDLSQLLTPFGGSYSYLYDHSADGFIKVHSRVANSGSALQLEGPAGPQTATTAQWQYSYVINGGGDGCGATVVDPGGNETVHYIHCNGGEYKTEVYEGQGTSRTLLSSSSVGADDHISAQNNTNFFVNGNPLNTSSGLAGGSNQSHTMTYASLGEVVRPYCMGPMHDPDHCGIFPAFYTQQNNSQDSAAVYYSSWKSDLIEANDGVSIPSLRKKVFAWETNSGFKLASLFDRIDSQSLTSPDETTTYGHTSFSYDESEHVPSGTLGQITTVNRWLNSSVPPLSDSYVYNSAGKVTRWTDPRGFAVALDYDANGIFPTNVTRPVTSGTAHSSRTSYDTNTGNILSNTDENGQTATFDYDDSGRPWSVKTPESGTKYSVVYCYATSTERRVIKATSSGLSRPDASTTCPASAAGVDMTQVVDGFGSPVRQVQRIASQTTMANTVRAANGQVAAISNPYTTAPSYWTSYAYDALGRLTRTCMQDNGTGSLCAAGSSYASKDYAGDAISSRDPKGNLSYQLLDGFGRLRGVTEPVVAGASGSATTSYSYDVRGNLVDVLQAGILGETAEERHFTYDTLSRLVTVRGPEMGRICYGLWAGVDCINGYDGNGNLLSKTDGRGVLTSYSYDGLNRLLSKTSTGGALGARSSCYRYDDALVSNGVGRLTAEWTQAFECPASTSTMPTTGVLTSRSAMAYDPMGRIKMESRCVLGHCNTQTPQQYNYDLAGDLTSYNDGRGVYSFSQVFDQSARLQTLSATLGATNTTLFDIKSYDPAGWDKAWLGNVMTLERTFDLRMRVAANTVKAGSQ